MAGIVRPRQPKPALETARQRRSRRAVLSASQTVESQSRSSRRPRTARRAAVRGAQGQSRGLPPVLVRGGIQSDMAIPTKKVSSGRRASRPRRRFDLTLNVPGAEVRLPSLPALRLGWRAASGLLVLMMSMCLYFLLFTPFFQVDVLQVEGLQRLTFEEVYPQLSVFGKPTVLVSPAQVTRELSAAFPEFSTIQVKVYMPGRIKLIVTERQPVLAWVQEGKEIWLDAEGVAFPPRGQAGRLLRVEAEGFPLSVGSTPPARPEPASAQPILPAQLIASLLAMQAYLPQEAPLLYSPERGFGWEDPHGWKVFFGKELDQVDQKLVIYQALSEELLNSGIQPSLISMEFLHAPYYRR